MQRMMQLGAWSGVLAGGGIARRFWHRVSAVCKARGSCCCSCRAMSPACREPPPKPPPLALTGAGGSAAAAGGGRAALRPRAVCGEGHFLLELIQLLRRGQLVFAIVTKLHVETSCSLIGWFSEQELCPLPRLTPSGRRQGRLLPIHPAAAWQPALACDRRSTGRRCSRGSRSRRHCGRHRCRQGQRRSGATARQQH